MGLVHDEELRLLAQGAGNEHQLLLAAGEGGEVPLRQVSHTQLLQGGQSLLLQGLGGLWNGDKCRVRPMRAVSSTE